MIDVARVDVRARIEQHIDDGLRGREMERSLPVAATLVHAGRVRRNHVLENVRAIQVRSRTCIHHRAGGNQPLGRLPRRGIERVERARPPLAPPVRVCTRLEQHAHHRRVTGVGDDRRRVEREKRLVDSLTQLRMVPKQPAHFGRVVPAERIVDRDCLVKRFPQAWSYFIRHTYPMSVSALKELLHIDLPIVQAPMAGVQGSTLAIAVSNTGALGSLPCAMLDLDGIRRELTAIRASDPEAVQREFLLSCGAHD